MSDWDRVLPPGDRDEVDVPKHGEKPSEFVERVNSATAPETKPDKCVCRARGWTCQHEPPFEVRLERIFRPVVVEAANPGAAKPEEGAK